MAKKRKLNSKSAETTSSTQQKKQQKKKDEEQQQQEVQVEEEELKQQKQEEQLKEEEEEKQQQKQEEAQPIEEDEEEEQEEEEEVEEEETEFEEVEEEVEEEEEEVEEEDDDDDEDPKQIEVEGGIPEDDDEPIPKLLEPFTKEQLIMILREAAENHADVAMRVRKVADEDTVHRKIFVHGLGWDTTADTLRSAFSQYGEIEDCKAVTDKVSGKSKGYGFILFKSRSGARKALESPQKRIGGRMTACQLAAVGPAATPPVGGGVSGVGQAGQQQQQPQSEYTMRKIYVSNVSADIEPRKLTEYFGRYGEIEEGPLGLDKQTGKPKGFCLFVYRSVESARKALEEPHKHFEGHVLHCQKAIDGPKPGKQTMGQGRGGSGGGHYGGRAENPNLAGAIGGAPATGAGLMGQSVGGVGYQGAAAAPGLNPALGQALTALLASQGAGLGLNNLLGTLGGGMAGPPGAAGGHGPYGAQGVGVNPSVLGGYGGQGGLQSAYPNQQGGGGGRSHGGHMGGVAPYSGH